MAIMKMIAKIEIARTMETKINEIEERLSKPARKIILFIFCVKYEVNLRRRSYVVDISESLSRFQSSYKIFELLKVFDKNMCKYGGEI